MEPQPWMEQVQLLDCSGQVTHTLVLLLDGTVEVRFRSGIRGRIDPRRRCCLTAGVVIPPGLYDAAATMVPS